MLGDEFRSKYKLLKRFTSKGIRSYQAVDPEGRSVMVHVLAISTPKAQKLLRLLDNLAPQDKSKITARLEVEGTPVLVTEVLEDFETLPAWLYSRLKTLAEEPGPSEPGEFTRLFGPQQEVVEKRESPAAEPPAVEPEVQSEAPDDVARLAGRAEVEADAEAAAEKTEPGEYTRLFGAKAAPSEPETAAEEAKRKKPTIHWREERPADSEPQVKPVVRWKKKGPPEAAPPVVEPTEAPTGQDAETTGGEFTKLFRQSAPRTPPIQEDAARGGEKSESPLERSTGEYLRALDPSIPVREDKPARGTPAAIEPPSVVPPSEVPAFAAQRSPDDGPSEFTRLVSGGAAQPGTPAKSAAPEYDEEPAPRGATPSLRVLVIGLSAVVIAIVVLIILFAVL